MDDHVTLQPGPTPPAQLLIPQDLAQAIANYLSTRPAGEVHHFLGALLALQPQQEKE